MARPKGTYVSQVFNFGVDKRIPFGFVDLVIDRDGNTVGFEKNGKFYNLGDKLPAPAKKPLTSDQLDKKKNLLTTKLALAERQASATNIGETERNRYIAEFKKTQDELADTEKSFLETQILEGKIKEAEANKKVAQTVRLDITRLEQRKDLLDKLGKSTFEIDSDIKRKKATLASVQTKDPLNNAPTISGPDAARQGKPSSVLPATPASTGTQTATGKQTPGFTASGTDTPPPKTLGKTPPKTPADETPPVDKTPPVDREAEALNVAAGTDFTLPETLFKNIPSLTALLKKYVSTPGMTSDAFRKALRDDIWYKQNSEEIKARYVQYYNYRDLQAADRATGSTDYEMQIAKIEASLKKRAVEIGSAAASDPAALRKAAENLYITNRSEDQSFVDDFLAASIRPIAGMIGGKGTQGYSGQALTNYQELVKTARSNGFQVSDIIPGGANEQQILQGIASGKIDINRIIQDARKLAAQGQPQYVRDLLSQGYNLDQVFAPYRQVMANILEVGDPDQIDLNDPVLRSAINDKGDMNLFDFKRQLRQDNRWQYTQSARDEVSGAAMKVLQDFGFQG
jgi:hypothetical protein